MLMRVCNFGMSIFSTGICPAIAIWVSNKRRKLKPILRNSTCHPHEGISNKRRPDFALETRFGHGMNAPGKPSADL